MRVDRPGERVSVRTASDPRRKSAALVVVGVHLCLEEVKGFRLEAHQRGLVEDQLRVVKHHDAVCRFDTVVAQPRRQTASLFHVVEADSHGPVKVKRFLRQRRLGDELGVRLDRNPLDHASYAFLTRLKTDSVSDSESLLGRKVESVSVAAHSVKAR